jgi:hypothetical protein
MELFCLRACSSIVSVTELPLKYAGCLGNIGVAIVCLSARAAANIKFASCENLI